MIEVTVKLVNAVFSELADLRVEKDAVGVVAHRKEFADRGVGCDADRLVVLDGND